MQGLEYSTWLLRSNRSFLSFICLLLPYFRAVMQSQHLAARSFRIKRSYRPAFLSQKFLCSLMAIYLPVRASVPPLPGVFQQGGTRRAKRPAPCPMHAPAIPAHHEGNSFDLLFLVQAPNSFLFYTRLVSSNCLSEEKAGRLYAVCLLSDAKARSRARLTAPGRARCRPVPSARC